MNGKNRYKTWMTCSVRLGGVVGLPAVLGERMVGRVERAVLAPDGRHLRGLVVRKGLGGAKWADRSSIYVLGQVSVVLLERPGHVPKDSSFALRTVKDTGGMTLGWVTDVYLNPYTLRVTALEVTLGLLEELRYGRLLVRDWSVLPGAGEGAQVLIPCKAWEVIE